jgi:hypothetical protein
MSPARLAHQPVVVDVHVEDLPQHAVGVPQHALGRRGHHHLGLGVLVANAHVVVALVSWDPARDAPSARPGPLAPRPIPGALAIEPWNRWTLGSIALGDPLAAVLADIGPPDLVSPMLTRSELTWRFEGLTLRLVGSGDAAPVVLQIDARVTDVVEGAPRLTRGVTLGSTTVGGLVGAWGTPGDTGMPTPTSVRYATCHGPTEVTVEADAGTWDAAFSAPVRHVLLRFVDASTSSLCAPSRR